MSPARGVSMSSTSRVLPSDPLLLDALAEYSLCPYLLRLPWTDKPAALPSRRKDHRRDRAHRTVGAPGERLRMVNRSRLGDGRLVRQVSAVHLAGTSVRAHRVSGVDGRDPRCPARLPMSTSRAGLPMSASRGERRTRTCPGMRLGHAFREIWPLLAAGRATAVRCCRGVTPAPGSLVARAWRAWLNPASRPAGSCAGCFAEGTMGP